MLLVDAVAQLVNDVDEAGSKVEASVRGRGRSIVLAMTIRPGRRLIT